MIINYVQIHINNLQSIQINQLKCIRKALRFLKNSVTAMDFKSKSIRFAIKTLAVSILNDIPNINSQLLQYLSITEEAGKPKETAP